MTPTPEDEIAHHEAGHAVVEVVLGTVPDYVTIVQSGDAGGASGHTGGHKVVHGPSGFDQMTVSYAGYAAHVKFAPRAEERARIGAQTDFANAEQVMNAYRLSPVEPEAVMALKRGEAARIVDENWPAIQRVAQALMVEKTIDAERLQELIAEGS